MLASHPIDPMILATDLTVAREFYGGKVGLEVVLESDDFVTDLTRSKKSSSGVTSTSASTGSSSNRSASALTPSKATPRDP